MCSAIGREPAAAARIPGAVRARYRVKGTGAGALLAATAAAQKSKSFPSIRELMYGPSIGSALQSLAVNPRVQVAPVKEATQLRGDFHNGHYRTVSKNGLRVASA